MSSEVSEYDDCSIQMVNLRSQVWDLLDTGTHICDRESILCVVYRLNIFFFFFFFLHIQTLLFPLLLQFHRK